MDGLDAEKHAQTVLNVVNPDAGPPAVDAGERCGTKGYAGWGGGGVLKSYVGWLTAKYCIGVQIKWAFGEKLGRPPFDCIGLVRDFDQRLHAYWTILLKRVDYAEAMRRYVKMTNLHDIEPDANQAAYMYIYTEL
jgi:hypothetical protein